MKNKLLSIHLALFLLGNLCAPAYAGLKAVSVPTPLPESRGGTGATSLGNNFTNSGGVLNLTQTINAQQTATTYTVLTSDLGGWITHTASSPVAVTVPQAGSAGFESGKGFCDVNYGTATVTLTPTAGTVNGLSSLGETTGQFSCWTSDGSNWVATASSSTSGTASSFNATSVANGYQMNGGNGLRFPNSDTTSIAIGNYALSAQVTNASSIGIGKYAGYSTSGTANIFIGSQSGYYPTSGNYNTGVGHYTFQSNAGTPMAGGNDNTAIGYSAINHPEGAINQNTAVGRSTLGGNPFTGSYNSVLGYHAGYAVTTGSYNTLIGHNSGVAIVSGQHNTVIGPNVGPTLTNGGYNILLGTSNSAGAGGADVPASSTSYWLNIGNSILADMHAPTISSGFGTSPSVTHGTSSFAFTVNVGTGGTASSGVIAFTTGAPNGWACQAVDVSNYATMNTIAVPVSATTIRLANYSRTTGLATAWAASDVIAVSCAGY